MIENDRYRFLDIGGGGDWGVGFSVEAIAEDINNLRCVRLAKENPDIEYFIFDQYIPTAIIAKNTQGISNLQFVKGHLGTNHNIPFSNASMDRVEMSHMYTPLTAKPQSTYLLEQDVTLYLHPLAEACRVLKSGGTLVITEKQERLNRIRQLLSRDGRFLDGFWMSELGLDTGTNKLAKITDPNRTKYAKFSMKDQKSFEERGDRKHAADYTVFSLELRKKVD